jgi:hypothetical protein
VVHWFQWITKWRVMITTQNNSPLGELGFLTSLISHVPMAFIMFFLLRLRVLLPFNLNVRVCGCGSDNLYINNGKFGNPLRWKWCLCQSLQNQLKIQISYRCRKESIGTKQIMKNSLHNPCGCTMEHFYIGDHKH